MSSRLIVVFCFVVLIVADFVCAQNPNLTTKNLVEGNGYPFESHIVVTEDGYRLALHRIPYSPSRQSSSQQQLPIAFLNHGLLGSSSDFVLLGVKKALAYLLSDAGYDVWIGNDRGNTYSRSHIEYNADTIIGPFWDFTFHEVGTQDLPAMIDFIRNHTGQDQMHFVGHSIGTTAFYVMSSLKEEYQKYIKSAHLLTPLVYLENLSKVFLEVGSKVVALLTPVLPLAGSTEFRPNGTITKIAGAALCDDEPRVLCSDILFVVDGFNNITVEPSIINDVLDTTPAGTSTKTFLHYFQLHNFNKFLQYDYGLVGNLAKYGSIIPPIYPVEKVDVPVFLYYGAEDRLVHDQDIERISTNTGNVRDVFKIPNVTHQYPIYGPDVENVLYGRLLNDMASLK